MSDAVDPATDGTEDRPDKGDADGTEDTVSTPAGTVEEAVSDGADGDDLLIKCENIVAGYIPEVDILNGCNLDLFRGELVGIIGPNGAGKSTLLKALFGLVRVRSGLVTYDGDDITNLKAHTLVERGIGYVPQNNNIFPSLTVRENLEMGAYLDPSQFTERHEFVAEMFPRLAERSSQRAGALSGGERQMLAMGRALMMSPRVILLDEPSAGLSPVLQDQVFVNAKRINKTGVSVIMVEQNASRCLQICDRGYVLDQGRNAYTDSGRNLLADPKVIELYLGTLATATDAQGRDRHQPPGRVSHFRYRLAI